MPMTAAQLLAGANTQLASYSKKDPVDQFTTKRPFAKWLMDNAEQSIFGNGVYNEKILIGDSSNYQNYTGDDQVTYNRKDNYRLAPFQDYEAHDGFAMNETELAHNGVNITEDKEAVMTDAEKIQIVNIIKGNRTTLKSGFQRNLDLELHRDGTQSSKAVPGLDLLVSTTPTSSTVIGGINQNTSPYWQNFASLNIASTAGVLNSTMESVYRQCTTYGDGEPDFIVAGSKFVDAYAKDVRTQPGTTLFVTTPATGGVKLDGSRTGIFFKGIEILWDPSFDVLQTLDNPTTPWDKRCYFLNSMNMRLRPVKGRWMIPRTPPRIYDRYTHYFGLTANYGLTVNKRNGQAVMSIA